MHFRGSVNPSNPGFTFKFGIISLHDRHWIDIVVAFALIPDAAMMIPATLTKRDTHSDWKKQNINISLNQNELQFK